MVASVKFLVTEYDGGAFFSFWSVYKWERNGDYIISAIDH